MAVCIEAMFDIFLQDEIKRPKSQNIRPHCSNDYDSSSIFLFIRIPWKSCINTKSLNVREKIKHDPMLIRLYGFLFSIPL